MNKYAHRIEELGGEFVYSPSGELPRHLSEVELQSVEQRIGYSLPADYRELLRDFGGYAFYGVSYPVEGRMPASLSMFYGLKIGSTLDLLLRRESGLVNGDIAPEMLPIACDRARNQVCLFLAGEQIGAVYFWLADQAAAPYDYANLYRIADSFDEFMNSLYLRD